MVSNKEEPWLEDIVGDDARRLITSDAPLIRVRRRPGSGKDDVPQATSATAGWETS